MLFHRADVRAAFLTALLSGLLWLAVMTPLAIPDEEYHYRASWRLAHVLLASLDASPEDEALYFDFTGLRGHYNVRSGDARLYEFLPAGPAGESARAEDVPVRAFPLLYLPQAVGLALARVLRLGFGGAFWMGRGANLLFYAACLAAAVALAPRYRSVLTAAGLLPMALHQAASFSYDGALNGLALFYTGALLRAMTGQGRLGAREYWTLLVGAALLAPAKGGCLPLIALVGLIPAERFASRDDRRRKLLGLAGACVLFLALFLPAAAGRQLGGGLNWEGRANYTAAFALKHPVKTAGIFLRTLRTQGVFWLGCMAGWRLAGLTLALPGALPASALTLLPLAGAGEGPTKKRRAAFLAAAGGMVFLAMCVMLFTWTSANRDTIQGVQGRYFLPAAPYLALAAAPPRRPRRLAAIVTAASMLLNLTAAGCVLRYTLA